MNAVQKTCREGGEAGAGQGACLEREVKREVGQKVEEESGGQGAGRVGRSLEVKRKEVKYYINRCDAVAMGKALGEVLQRDGHDRGNGYFIRSLYFDSLENRAFEEKMMGVERRKKYRLRLYDFGRKEVKLELKSKFNNNILKESAWIRKRDAIALQEGNYDVLLEYQDPVMAKFCTEFKTFCYSPVVVIDYTRSAFVYDFNNIRITFDRDIKANTINLNMFNETLFMKPLLSSRLAVLEVKFDRFIPGWIKSILQMRNCHSAISKYCIGRLDSKIAWI